MMRSRCKTGIVQNLALAILLIAMQTMVSAHGFEHEPGNTQSQVCTTCVAASLLGSACVDHAPLPELMRIASAFDTKIDSGLHSIHALAVRQRGPPCLF